MWLASRLAGLQFRPPSWLATAPTESACMPALPPSWPQLRRDSKPAAAWPPRRLGFRRPICILTQKNDWVVFIGGGGAPPINFPLYKFLFFCLRSFKFRCLCYFAWHLFLATLLLCHYRSLLIFHGRKNDFLKTTSLVSKASRDNVNINNELKATSLLPIRH